MRRRRVELRPLSRLIFGQFAIFVFRRFLARVFFPFPRAKVFRSDLRCRFAPISLRLKVSFRNADRIINVITGLFIRLRRFLSAIFREGTLLKFFVMRFFRLVLRFFRVLSGEFRRIARNFQAGPIRYLHLLLRGPINRVLGLHVRLLPRFLRFFLLVLRPFFRITALYL